jgi:hypothetical protein
MTRPVTVAPVVAGEGATVGLKAVGEFPDTVDFTVTDADGNGSGIDREVVHPIKLAKQSSVNKRRIIFKYS